MTQSTHRVSNVLDDQNLIVREYLRVSLDRSGTGKSPDQQHDEITAEAHRRGWQVHSSYYRDDNRSASRYATRRREGFAQLIADLEEGKFEANLLAIWESSRGSRRTGEWIDLIDLCRDHGVQIWVLTHNRVYDPSNSRDRRSLREDASDAEYESDKTSERLQRDMRAAAKGGRPHGKNVYGYQRVYSVKPNGLRVLEKVVEHPDQAWVVKEAAAMVLAGRSYYDIAATLNEKNVPPRRPVREEHRKNLGWTAPAVKQMLTMPVYTGKRVHNPTEGETATYEGIWPPLINPEAWEKLQLAMGSRGFKSNNWPAKHLLSGIALCGECGARTRVGRQNGGVQKHDENGERLPRPRYHAYQCIGVPGRPGFHVSMREEHLDLIITELVQARLERPDFLATLGEQDEDVNAERNAVLEEIRGHQEWLDQVAMEAERRRDLRMLTEQRDLVEPKIEGARKKLELLAAADPLVLELAQSGRVREMWAEREESGDIVWQRHVIRELIVPRIHRVPPEAVGRKGPNPGRVTYDWR
ncbi:recombinase family protein [Cryobacterium tagatosivorans]|uniref:Recombinase family protein n=1 Tax=Cryobacterium tagatosivorans TaxID=1259199 RepID=A0A4R8UG18_9MICO|nr:recombinase family protein [Cryobacterium tagatosivorans]